MTSKPNPKAFMYLALGTVAVGGGLCYFQYTKLGDVNSRISKLRAEVSDPKAVQARLDQSNMDLEGAKQSLVHLEANVSSAAYVPSLLRDLDSYGKQNGIAVTGVRPATKPPGAVDPKAGKVQKPYDELSIQVTGTGSFDAIQNFVSNLPTFPKIVAARMVSIEPVKSNGPDSKTGLLNMTVQLKAYVFKADAAAVSADAPSTTAGAAAPNSVSGAAAPATKGTVPPAGQSVPAASKPAISGGAPVGAPITTTLPSATKPPVLTKKTALGRAGGVRVEG